MGSYSSTIAASHEAGSESDISDSVSQEASADLHTSIASPSVYSTHLISKMSPQPPPPKLRLTFKRGEASSSQLPSLQQCTAPAWKSDSSPTISPISSRMTTESVSTKDRSDKQQPSKTRLKSNGRLTGIIPTSRTRNRGSQNALLTPSSSLSSIQEPQHSPRPTTSRSSEKALTSSKKRQKLATVMLNTPRDFPRHLYIDLTDRSSLPVSGSSSPSGPSKRSSPCPESPNSTCHQCKHLSLRRKVLCCQPGCTRAFCSSCMRRYKGVVVNPDDRDFACPRCAGYCTCQNCLGNRNATEFGSVEGTGDEVIKKEEIYEEIVTSITPRASATVSQGETIVAQPAHRKKRKSSSSGQVRKVDHPPPPPAKKFRRTNPPPGATDLRKVINSLPISTDPNPDPEPDRSPSPSCTPPSFQALVPSFEEPPTTPTDLTLTLPVMGDSWLDATASTVLPPPVNEVPVAMSETPFSSLVLMPDYSWAPLVPPLALHHETFGHDERGYDWLDINLSTAC